MLNFDVFKSGLIEQGYEQQGDVASTRSRPYSTDALLRQLRPWAPRSGLGSFPCRSLQPLQVASRNQESESLSIRLAGGQAVVPQGSSPPREQTMQGGGPLVEHRAGSMHPCFMVCVAAKTMHEVGALPRTKARPA